jgi:hypothetical protein
MSLTRCEDRVAIHEVRDSATLALLDVDLDTALSSGDDPIYQDIFDRHRLAAHGPHVRCNDAGEDRVAMHEVRLLSRLLLVLLVLTCHCAPNP